MFGRSYISLCSTVHVRCGAARFGPATAVAGFGAVVAEYVRTVAWVRLLNVLRHIFDAMAADRSSASRIARGTVQTAHHPTRPTIHWGQTFDVIRREAM